MRAMPPNPACRIPTQFTAGDSLSWLRQAPSDLQPADGWLLHYVLVGQGGVYSFDGTAQGTAWQVSVDAATTAAWVPGRYTAQEYVSNGSQRLTLTNYVVVIAPDLAAATGPVDTRSHAQKVLDAIDAWLESKAPVAGSFEISGRKISYYPLADLLKLQSRYQQIVADELAANGGTAGVRILAQL